MAASAAPHTAHRRPEPAYSAGSDEPAPAPAADSIDASGAAGGTGASASSGSAASTLNSAQAARWPGHALAAHGREQKCVLRHAAHTSEVDAPQAAQGERDGAGDDMAATGAGGQREAREYVHAEVRFHAEYRKPLLSNGGGAQPETAPRRAK